MPKLCNILVFSILFYPSYAQTKKEVLCASLVESANYFSDFQPVLEIIQQQKNVFEYIPSIHPIAEKNNPRVTSNFGNRYHPIDKVNKFHSGIDFVAQYATTIHATANGKVIFAGTKGGYGKCVIIEHKFGFKTVYGHLTEFYTHQGKQVNKGDIIGFLGNTGKSTGAHLHYEVVKNDKKQNPSQYINMRYGK